MQFTDLQWWVVTYRIRIEHTCRQNSQPKFSPPPAWALKNRNAESTFRLRRSDKCLTVVPANQLPTRRKRKKFSAAARRRMKEAQQRRWAKVRGEFESLALATP